MIVRERKKLGRTDKNLRRKTGERGFAANEDAATKRMLKYLEDSEDLKVGLRELKEEARGGIHN